MSLCGGVNVILSPNTFVSLSKAHMASEAGQCHAFSERADGYARSEGCGIVLLKSLEQVGHCPAPHPSPLTIADPTSINIIMLRDCRHY